MRLTPLCTKIHVVLYKILYAYVGVSGCAFTSSVQVCIKDGFQHTLLVCLQTDRFSNPASSIHCVCYYTVSVSLYYLICVCRVDVCLFAWCHSFSLNSGHSAVV